MLINITYNAPRGFAVVMCRARELCKSALLQMLHWNGSGNWVAHGFSALEWMAVPVPFLSQLSQLHCPELTAELSQEWLRRENVRRISSDGNAFAFEEDSEEKGQEVQATPERPKNLRQGMATATASGVGIASRVISPCRSISHLLCLFLLMLRQTSLIVGVEAEKLIGVSALDMFGAADDEAMCCSILMHRYLNLEICIDT